MKFKLNREEFEDLRNSPEVVADLEARAARIEQAFGDGAQSTTDLYRGKKAPRAHVSVQTEPGDFRAMRRGNDLLKAMEAGRG